MIAVRGDMIQIENEKDIEIIEQAVTACFFLQINNFQTNFEQIRNIGMVFFGHHRDRKSNRLHEFGGQKNDAERESRSSGSENSYRLPE